MKNSNLQEIVVKQKFKHDDPEIIIHKRIVPDSKAMIALGFIERWGMVATKPDGGDSAGREKLALLTPEEVVDRAVKTVDIAFTRMSEQGWMSELPSYADAREAVKKIKRES